MEPSSGRYADREVQEGRGAGGRHSLRGGRAVPADLAGARPERPQPRDHGGCAGRGLEARHLADRVGAVMEPFAAGHRVADHRAEERQAARGQPGGTRRNPAGGNRRADRCGERAALSVPARFPEDGAANDGADAGAGKGLRVSKTRLRGRLYAASGSNWTRRSPSETRPPGATATSLILPDIGAVISFSIFMASMTRRMSPSATVSPGLTLTLITRPVIWAVTAPAAAGEVFFAAAFGRGRAPARPLTSTSYSLASTRSLTAPSSGSSGGSWTANGFSLTYTVAMLPCRTMRTA